MATHHIPSTYHQYQLIENGQPLQLRHVTYVPPSGTQVTVEVHASSINPLDYKLQDANLMGAPKPYPSM